jgi:hypothetical protein
MYSSLYFPARIHFAVYDAKFSVSFQVAADAEDKLFTATSCSVQALNSIWYDKLRPEQSRKRDEVALFIGFISFGLLAPVTVAYRQSEEVEIKFLKQTEKSGILQQEFVELNSCATGSCSMEK